MEIEQARAILAKCDAYIGFSEGYTRYDTGEPIEVPPSLILDGHFTLEELEALLLVEREEQKK